MGLVFDPLLNECISQLVPVHKSNMTNTFPYPCFRGKITNINIEETQRSLQLQTINLKGSDLRYSNIANQKIENFILDYSNLARVHFLNVEIKNIKAERVDLTGSIIEKSIFTNFNFKQANLNGAKIYKTRFSGGNFLKVQLVGTFISDSIFEDCIYSPKAFSDVAMVNVKFINCHEHN